VKSALLLRIRQNAGANSPSIFMRRSEVRQYGDLHYVVLSSLRTPGPCDRHRLEFGWNVGRRLAQQNKAIHIK
jgi:hypothetical protein